MSKPSPEITDIIDERLSLPKDLAHLARSEEDDDTLVDGQLRFLLNREVMDLYRDIADELEMSRGIPDDTHPGNIQMTDPAVQHLMKYDDECQNVSPDEALIIARQKSALWYEKQRRQISSDALFVAMTDYNELNVVPVPYKDGEIAFSTQGDETTKARRSASWRKGSEGAKIPPPARNLANIYERRLKQLYQIAEAAGMMWSSQFKSVVERGLVKTIRLAQVTDDEGFRPVTSDIAVHEKSRAKSKDKVGSS